MITQGQKLKEGDFVKVLTVHQCHSLLILDPNKPFYIEFYSITCALNGITYDNGTLCHSAEASTSIEEYSFPDFKQLCENTFGG